QHWDESSYPTLPLSPSRMLATGAGPDDEAISPTRFSGWCGGLQRPGISPCRNAHEPVQPPYEVGRRLQGHLRFSPVARHRGQLEVGDGEPAARDERSSCQVTVEHLGESDEVRTFLRQ